MHALCCVGMSLCECFVKHRSRSIGRGIVVDEVSRRLFMAGGVVSVCRLHLVKDGGLEGCVIGCLTVVVAISSVLYVHSGGGRGFRGGGRL